MYKKILVPTDGSSLAATAAQAAIQFAKQIGAEAVGLFVAPEYQYPIYLEALPGDYPSNEEYRASMAKFGETFLQDLRTASDAAGVKFTGITLISNATAQTIAKTASEQGCDLIFMGSHGRSGIGQLLLGSVTTKVLSSCEVPVLVYRSRHGATANHH
jgi:nucleotide-binding universal stress UspA family protein